MSPPYLVTAISAILLSTSLLAEEPKELQDARLKYEQASPYPTEAAEAARSHYVTRLVRMRETFARLETDDWQAIDAEIKRHPAPPDSDAKALSRLLVGEWQSPRHDYLYRADGTWAMLPAEEGSPNGHWRIGGNQYFNKPATDQALEEQFTIILLTATDFVFADKENVFYEKRIRK